MKRCPECRKDYLDDSLLYCLDDGTPLVQGTAAEPATAIFSGESIGGESATRKLFTDNLLYNDRHARSRLFSSRIFAWFLVGILSLALIGLGIVYFRRPVAVAEPIRLFLNPPNKALLINYPAMSPDGRTLAFIARVEGVSRIWIRPLGSSTSKPLAGTDSVERLFWSPDSRFLAFSADGKLQKIALADETLVTLCKATGISSGTWNDEGVILFASESSKGLQRVGANGGEIVNAKILDVDSGHLGYDYPFFLPDGRHFLFHVQSNDFAKQGIYVSSLDGEGPTQLVTTEIRTAWAGEDPNDANVGYLVFMQQGAILAQPFDLGRNQLTGEPRRIVERAQTNLGQFNGRFSVASKALVAIEGVTNLQLTWIDRTGENVGTIGPVGPYGARDLSPDDKRLTFSRFEPKTSTQDIWLLDLERSGATRFTVDPADDAAPRWSPDGSRIAWISRRNGLYGIYMKAASGVGADELLYESADNKVTMGWTPDGRFLLFRNLSPDTGNDIWIMPLDGDRKPWPWLATEFSESSNSPFSPDGKWIAYSSDESGRGEVYIQAFEPPAPASGAKWRISTEGGGLPRWRRDGRGLYYVVYAGKLMETDLSFGEGVKTGISRELFDTRAIKAEMSRGWTITSDEQRFLFVTHSEENGLPPFTVLVNWAAEMKK